MIVFSVVFIGFLISHKCDQLFAFVFSPNIIRGNGCPQPFLIPGAVAANGPKGTSSSRMYEALSYFSSAPLSHEMEPVPSLMAEEED